MVVACALDCSVHWYLSRNSPVGLGLQLFEEVEAERRPKKKVECLPSWEPESSFEEGEAERLVSSWWIKI